jgi:hypothetical protein
MSMHADEESDEGIVPMKRSNNEGVSSAETGEGRASPKGNGGGTAAVRTLRRDTASEVYPARRPLLSANQDATRLAMSPLRRQNPREEPGALAAHAGVCAGGGERSSSLPRPLPPYSAFDPNADEKLSFWGPVPSAVHRTFFPDHASLCSSR